MTEREMIEVSRPCVRNELRRCEQNIRMIERMESPPPSHLNPKNYLAALNVEADRLRGALDAIDAYLGLNVCEDCPPIGYPTDETRCDECPRKSY